MRLTVLLFLFFLSAKGFSSNDKVFASEVFSRINFGSMAIDTSSNQNITKTKIIAVSLAITLGVFGVHRLYLGTKATVPIAYTLTLGGGLGILPIVDIIYIIKAKNITQLINNDYVFMWNKE